MRLSGSGVLAVVALAGAGLLVALLWKYRERFNPASDKNLAYQGAGAVVAAATGGKETTVGGLLASAREWLSGDEAKIEAMKRGAPPIVKSPAKSVLAPVANDLDAELRAGYNGVPANDLDAELRAGGSGW